MSGILGTLASMPDDERLREKVREVLSRRDYQTNRAGDETPWMLELMMKGMEALAGFLRWWLFEFTESWPMALRVIVTFGMVVLLVSVIVHGFFTLFRAMRGTPHQVVSVSISQSPLTSARDWERLADEAAAQGEWIAAVRHLFRACLAQLEERERRPFRRGTTNRGHLRRYRNAAFCDSLELLVLTIERKWYGDEVCDAKDYEACRQAHSRVTASVASPQSISRNALASG